MNQNDGTHHNFQMTPYAIPNPSPVPAELNARHKEEYFHLWKGFACIPRPFVMWVGGFAWYFAISLFFAGFIADVARLSNLYLWLLLAWLILATVGTVKFYKGAKQIRTWYPHLGLSSWNLTKLRKIARKNVGYTYKDTFKAVFTKIRLQGLFTAIGGFISKIHLPQFDLFQNLTNNNEHNRELVATIQSYPSRADEMQYLRNLERQLS